MRLLHLAILTIPFALLPAASHAQSPLCTQLNEAIMGSLSEIGQNLYEGINDKSAPRETVRQLQVTNEIGFIGLNLQLLNSSKCMPWKTPFLGFLSAARKCQAAMHAPTNAEVDEACKPFREAGKATNK